MAVEVPEALPWEWPEGPVRRFASPATGAGVRIAVRVAEPQPPAPGSLRFDSDGGIFDVAREGEEFVIALRIRGELVRTVRFDADFTRGELTVAPDSFYARQRMYPLAYPLDEVVFLHRVVREGGLLLHAAGLARDDRGRVFTGPSGAGKTTLTRLMQHRAGLRVLSDDRIVLRPEGCGVRIFGTPWHGEAELSEAGSARLVGIHAIHHAPGVVEQSLSGAEAAGALLGNAFLPAHDPVGSREALAFADHVVCGVPVSRLGFARDERVVQHIWGASRSDALGPARDCGAAAP